MLDSRLADVELTLNTTRTKWPPAPDVAFDVAEDDLRVLATELGDSAWRAVSEAHSALISVRMGVELAGTAQTVDEHGIKLRDVALGAVADARTQLLEFTDGTEVADPPAVPARG